MVKALQALRGLALVAAATLVAELGDITRFANPRQFMAYLGLVPSEHSSGTRDARADHQGGQWRGAAHVDRGGMELPVSSTYRSRLPSAPRKVEQADPRHSLEGPEQLCRRYRKLAHAGKLKTVITAAIARELSGFVWAIAKQTRPESRRASKLKSRDCEEEAIDHNHPKLGKAGGTVTARRTLVSTNSRILSDAGS